MNDFCMWSVATITALVALNTVWHLWSQRERLALDDLDDIDRAFAWRVVIFLVFPLLNLLDLRSTVAACDLAGGYIKSWNYLILWYQAVPSGLPSSHLVIAVLFAGSLVTSLFALCLLPSLSFRPHPFLATVIGYTVAFTLGYNLIADPLMSMVGLGSMRWQLALTYAPQAQHLPLIAVHIALALLYLAVIRNTHVRLWFSELTRPYANEHLKDALQLLNTSPASARLSCLVGILFEQAGMRYKAKSQLKTMKALFPMSPFSYFLDALVAYSKHDYKTARYSFLHTSDFQGVDGELKASLLAASACAAFADNDLGGALNLCERALEFDDKCLVSRMVKVDVLLRQGSKTQAGDEILDAMHLGLSMELEGKVPLDIEQVYNELVDMEERSGVTELIGVAG